MTKSYLPSELRERIRLDYQICQDMFGYGVFTGEAYATDSDLKHRRNPIRSVVDGDRALHYRIDFHVKTLIGRDRYSYLTTMSFNLDVPDYPLEQPHIWLMSHPEPYSPHFNRWTVCIDSIWKERDGYMLLGELLVDIARLLNWDSLASKGYRGEWNPDAADYYQSTFHNAPITSNMRYPLLPFYLLHGTDAFAQEGSSQEPAFTHHAEAADPATYEMYPFTSVPSELFRGREEIEE